MKQEHPKGSIFEPPGCHQDGLHSLKDPNYHCTCVRQFPIANEIEIMSSGVAQNHSSSP